MCQQLLFKFFESYCEMYKKFEELLKTNGCTEYKVSKATGIPGSTFTEWKKGKYQPKSDKLQKIADYFNVPLGYFYGEEENSEASCREAIQFLKGMDMVKYALENSGYFHAVKFTDKEISMLIKQAKLIVESRD